MPISGKHPNHFEGIQRSDSFSPQSVLPVLELRTGWTHFGLASLNQHDVCEMHQCCLGPWVPPGPTVYQPPSSGANRAGWMLGRDAATSVVWFYAHGPFLGARKAAWPTLGSQAICSPQLHR